MFHGYRVHGIPKATHLDEKQSHQHGWYASQRQARTEHSILADHSWCHNLKPRMESYDILIKAITQWVPAKFLIPVATDPFP